MKYPSDVGRVDEVIDVDAASHDPTLSATPGDACAPPQLPSVDTSDYADTTVGTDGPVKFLRAEYVRGISADDPDFDRVYGMRSDVESLNAQLEHAFHKQRIPALGTANKTMVLMFAALAQNAWARHAWLREVEFQAGPPPPDAA